MDVSTNMGSIAQMKAEHEQNKLREVEMNREVDPLRKKSEEEVRKLSAERRTKVAEKRRMSTNDNPNGVPIMAAFQKV
uniref:Small VCP/p97-interacting protein n=1 Tax=Heterorhabditis bacteriophora TaxID=37862 RepID=A0A1I7XI81_HETBA